MAKAEVPRWRAGWATTGELAHIDLVTSGDQRTRVLRSSIARQSARLTVALLGRRRSGRWQLVSWQGALDRCRSRRDADVAELVRLARSREHATDAKGTGAFIDNEIGVRDDVTLGPRISNGEPLATIIAEVSANLLLGGEQRAA